MQAMHNNIADQKVFYDNFTRKLLVDYIKGNPRVVSALKYTLSKIPLECSHVLDIGCGIGWSSHEIKRQFVSSHVTGVDLSPSNIEIAKRLFRSRNLLFNIVDVTCEQSFPDGIYDAVVMLDVYEHISIHKRVKLHAALKSIMPHDGMLVMTFPNVRHQEYLRDTNPSALQPVDENITRQNIDKLACDIDGVVDEYTCVSIWREQDYVHVTLRRNGHVKLQTKVSYSLIAIENKKQRCNRVRASLSKRITKDGLILGWQPGPVVCIIAPDKNVYSETFIQAHLENLPTTIRFLYGGFFPTITDEGASLTPNTGALLRRLIYKSISRIVLKVTNVRMEEVLLRRYFKKHNVKAVLAEYGATGVRVMQCCKKAGIPVIVHFHGYDAYSFSALQNEGRLYPQLFKTADALVVVSRDMEHQLKHLGALAEKIRYNPYGVETTLFGDADPAMAPPMFVAVGRFVDKKAPHLTLAAFRIVLEEQPDARLVFIGDGPLLESCRQLARAWDIDNTIEFMGACSHAEVACAMRRSRVFIQHSLRTSSGDSEGTPVAVLEACASGLPVIATRHAGIKDVVIEGETGFLVSEGDINTMAKHMLLLAQDSKLAAHLGKAGREYIRIHFNMEKSIKGLWDIITEAIDKNIPS